MLDLLTKIHLTESVRLTAWFFTAHPKMVLVDKGSQVKSLRDSIPFPTHQNQMISSLPGVCRAE